MPAAIMREATDVVLSGRRSSLVLLLREAVVLSKAPSKFIAANCTSLVLLKVGDEGVGGGGPGRSDVPGRCGVETRSVSVSELLSASSSHDSAGCAVFELGLAEELICSLPREDVTPVDEPDAMVWSNREGMRHLRLHAHPPGASELSRPNKLRACPARPSPSSRMPGVDPLSDVTNI